MTTEQTRLRVLVVRGRQGEGMWEEKESSRMIVIRLAGPGERAGHPPRTPGEFSMMVVVVVVW